MRIHSPYAVSATLNAFCILLQPLGIGPGDFRDRGIAADMTEFNLLGF